MGLLIFLIWIGVAHVRYIISAVKETNSTLSFSEKYFSASLETTLIEKYVAALFWPYTVFMAVVQYCIDGIFGFIYMLRDIENYFIDIYWDFQCFYAFLQEMILIEEHKYDI